MLKNKLTYFFIGNFLLTLNNIYDTKDKTRGRDGLQIFLNFLYFHLLSLNIGVGSRKIFNLLKVIHLKNKYLFALAKCIRGPMYDPCF